MRPLSCVQVLQRGLKAAPSSNIWGLLFLGMPLVETQTVTKLCGFGRGPISPTSRVQLVSVPTSLNHLADSVPLRSAVQRDHNAVQSWDFQSMSHKEDIIWEPEGQVLGCVATLWGGGAHSFFPCQLNPCYPKKGRSAHSCPTGLWEPSPNETLWISPAKSRIPCPARLSYMAGREST